MAERPHDHSFSLENVADFLPDPWMFSIFATKWFFVRLKAVLSEQLLPSFVNLLLHAKTLVAEPPFNANSATNSSAIALICYCSNENLEHL